jgi:uncharacterized membrane protein
VSDASAAATTVRTGHHRRTLGQFEPTPVPVRNTYRQTRATFGTQDRIALAVTGAVGTMYAVYLFIVIMATWILVQELLGPKAFDPYPFAFLLFLGNIVQLLLMPLLLVGQNLQARHAQARSDNEYRTTNKIFHDIEQTMSHLDAQDVELLKQSNLLMGLVETLVPAERRAAVLAAAGAIDPAGGTPTAAGGTSTAGGAAS